ncbi:hypothetical protein CDAR_452751 [Caerostris darwini]|uniref:Ycf15 n=1 Tax=Caerostris darwini TaxID=1538125 RepID=A0AAV4SJG3_9ARAC|nr:hypothetical protein CDAR_452751 [Caerostris darwini]
MFFAYRTSKILESLPSNSWHYVSSKENPADIATRGINPQNLESCRLWWHGPNFLHQDFNYCSLEDPASERVPEELLEQRSDPIFSNWCTISPTLQDIF